MIKHNKGYQPDDSVEVPHNPPMDGSTLRNYIVMPCKPCTINYDNIATLEDIKLVLKALGVFKPLLCVPEYILNTDSGNLFKVVDLQ